MKSAVDLRAEVNLAVSAFTQQIHGHQSLFEADGNVFVHIHEERERRRSGQAVWLTKSITPFHRAVIDSGDRIAK